MNTFAETTRSLGRNLLSLLEEIGGGALLSWRVFRAPPQIFRSWRLTMDQMPAIGNRSMPLVLVVSIFTGAVTA
ncbi:hypothetical protein H8E07_21180, partial [bacterium]|nr:hypothetical protein [bacterium]